MNSKEIRDLIEFLVDKDIAEFELERGDVKVRVKRAGSAPQIVTVAAATQPVIAAPAPIAAPTIVASAAPAGQSVAPANVASTAPSAPAEAPADDTSGAHVIKSPIVGTFYESPSPGAPPFVKPGDSVSVGQVLCIVEAMKLMNEIESDYSGTIIKRFVENGSPVEYGQPLFAVKP